MTDVDVAEPCCQSLVDDIMPTMLQPSTFKEGEENRCKDVPLPGDGTCSLTGQA